ncbi:hypothetical protein [Polaromonas naphthalenivorans]|uniref:IrrE N-terminal-like domain-containing protein n=1 Tax=Polaromonas naphthalenivorans (strain CJ2) TaxID=365044 RepID=A1VL32_POLNA|nr:hypothetical protein [Polaromonas naphthalenivorans]ABM36360.1 conserved hypothetical protein [Polaromonas naphthalenivorans CJ2]
MNALSWVVRACRLALFMLSASVSMHAGAATKFDAMDPLGTLRKDQVSKKQAITIDVAPGDWGNADVRDIKRVLDSVAAELLTHAGTSSGALSIRVIPRRGSPKVLYERGVEGQYVIQLTARDERWFQYVFQFSHELCHVLSNFDHKETIGDGKVDESNQWFEEALCETASLFTLRRLAVVWETNPPTRNWTGYAPLFSAYALRLMSESHRHLPAGQSLRDWYAQNQSALSDNPYLREKNELVAANLLPLFEAHPELWQSITYLNPTKTSASKPFAQYMADWQAASLDKTLADQVLELFGLADGGESRGEKLAAIPLAPRTSMNGPAGD